MIECKEMDESRRAYKLEDKKSLLKWMEQRKNKDTNVTMLEFLGNTRQPISFYNTASRFFHILVNEMWRNNNVLIE